MNLFFSCIINSLLLLMSELKSGLSEARSRQKQIVIQKPNIAFKEVILKEKQQTFTLSSSIFFFFFFFVMPVGLTMNKLKGQNKFQSQKRRHTQIKILPSRFPEFTGHEKKKEKKKNTPRSCRFLSLC